MHAKKTRACDHSVPRFVPMLSACLLLLSPMNEACPETGLRNTSESLVRQRRDVEALFEVLGESSTPLDEREEAITELGRRAKELSDRHHSTAADLIWRILEGLAQYVKEQAKCTLKNDGTCAEDRTSQYPPAPPRRDIVNSLKVIADLLTRLPHISHGSRRLDLSKTNLRGIKLTRILRRPRYSLSDVSIRKSTLAQWGDEVVHLFEVDFSRSNLAGADLSGACIQRGIFTGTCLRNAKLIGTDLTEARFEKVDLTRANLSDAIMTRSRILYSILDFTVLRKSKLRSVVLVGSRLKRTDLREADLGISTLSYSEVADVNIDSANLYKFKFLRNTIFGLLGSGVLDSSAVEITESKICREKISPAMLRQLESRTEKFTEFDCSDPTFEIKDLNNCPDPVELVGDLETLSSGNFLRKNADCGRLSQETRGPVEAPQ